MDSLDSPSAPVAALTVSASGIAAAPPHTIEILAAGHRLEIRGARVTVDAVARPLTPTALATLRVLAARPGAVVSRDALLAALPGGGITAHAVETAVLRLRNSLGAPEMVRTVVKRGYRLAVDHPETPGQPPGNRCETALR